jgi:hypothetical protein
MDIEAAVEKATEALDNNPAMSTNEATGGESLEFVQGIAEWAETWIDALKADLEA